MRCEECGYSLVAIPSGAPCPECGQVTPDEMRNPNPQRVGVLRFGWPIALAFFFALLGGGLASGESSLGGAMICGILMLLTVGVVTPINTWIQTARLVKRLPRRVRHAPLLLMVPRSFAIPALASLGSIAVTAVLCAGACLIGLR